MKLITLIVEIEVDEEEFKADAMMDLLNEFENTVSKHNYDLYETQWFEN